MTTVMLPQSRVTENREHYFFPEFLSWMRENVGMPGRDWFYRKPDFLPGRSVSVELFEVENEDHAVLTKLTWGGL